MEHGRSGDRDREADARAASATGRFDEAATLLLRAYGKELLEYSIAMARSEVDGCDAFSLLSERLWRGLPTFRWESSARTWCYVLAHRAIADTLRGGAARRAVPLSDAPEVAALVEQVRTQTLTFLRTEARDAFAELRASLSPEERELLVLRLDRKLPWREVAMVMSADEDLDPAALERRSAALRKQWEVMKTKLRTMVKRIRQQK
jgi:RNA polymerase sigma-70 factor, ECF subfamily